MAKKKSTKKRVSLKDAFKDCAVTKCNGYDLVKDNKTGKTFRVPWDIN